MNHLCIVFPSFQAGGAEKVGVDLANAFYSQGIVITVLVFLCEGPLRNRLNPSVNVVSLNTSARSPVRFLAKTLRQVKPDVVLSMYRKINALVGLSRYWFKDYRWVAREANSFDDIKGKNSLRRLKNILKLRVAYRQADALISNTRGAMTDIRRWGLFADDRMHFVPNPYDFVWIQQRREAPPQHPWFDANSRMQMVLSIGRLHSQKNHHLLLEAFAQVLPQIPNAHLVIVGEGPLKESLLRRIDALELSAKVSLVGYQENVYQWLNRAQLFVLCSNREGFPNVLVEALACGVSVVATNCPGETAHILQHGLLGTLVPTNDVKSLSAALVDQLITPLNWQQAYPNALNAFSADQVLLDYMQILNVPT